MSHAEHPLNVGVLSQRSAGWGIAKHFILFASLLAVWQIFLADKLLFPWPVCIDVPLTEMIEADERVCVSYAILDIFTIDGTIWQHLWATVRKALVGMAVGTLIGMGLGVAAAVSVGFHNYLKPYIIIIEATPRIAIGPVFVAWFGFGMGSAVALAALVCFFAPFVNTLTGLLDIDEESEELFRSMGASKYQIFWKLRVPNAMPLIAAGLKLAAAGAFGGALVAEFIAAQNGLGVLISRFSSALAIHYSFATLLSITAFGFLLFQTMDAINYRVLYWRSDKLMAQRSRRLRKAWHPFGAPAEAAS